MHNSSIANKINEFNCFNLVIFILTSSKVFQDIEKVTIFLFELYSIEIVLYQYIHNIINNICSNKELIAIYSSGEIKSAFD